MIENSSATTTAAGENTVTDVLRRATSQLHAHSDSPRLDAQLLLATILGISRSALIARSFDPISDDTQRAFFGLIVRRQHGTPIAYLTGTREFWSMNLRVSPAVLVPRPETEILVEVALRLLLPNADATILDLGTGSGAIALAIAHERPQATITAVEISTNALAVARENSKQLGLTKIHWRQGSWFDATPNQRFDLIVSNPPYVASNDPALKLLKTEPAIALSPGPSGLEAFNVIIAGAAAHLNKSGWLILEHGCAQADDIAALLRQHGFTAIETHLDLSNQPRVTRGTI